MRKRLNITVHGLVQGVAFRYYTVEKAQQLGLKGFVKNQPDGTVYIEAEGEDRVLRDFVAWCRQGPPHARVTQVLTTESDRQPDQGFEIRY